MLCDAAIRTMSISGMVMWILFGAACFTSVFFRTGGQAYIADFLIGLENPVLIFGFILAVLIVMGCFLDEITQVMITVPIFLPIIIQLGYDPVWFGIIVVVLTEIGLITPPIGMNVFVLKANLPQVPVGKIFKGLVPFIAVDVVRLALLVSFPAISLLLVRMMN